MPGFFDNQTITLECGSCGNKSEETVARLKTSPSITCAKCGTVTNYDAEDLRVKLAESEKLIDQFREKYGATFGPDDGKGLGDD